MKTIINIKADREVKNQAKEVARAMGLPLSSIVNAFLKEFINERRVEFFAPLQPSKKLQVILRKSKRDLKKGKNLEGPFSSASEMIKSLNS